MIGIRYAKHIFLPLIHINPLSNASYRLLVLNVVNKEQRKYLLVIINTLGRISEINNLTWDEVYEDYLILKTCFQICAPPPQIFRYLFTINPR